MGRFVIMFGPIHSSFKQLGTSFLIKKNIQNQSQKKRHLSYECEMTSYTQLKYTFIYNRAVVHCVQM